MEDLVTNLIKNWKKEASHKARLEEWRTIDPEVYKFTCNGSKMYTAEEMMYIGTSNALIQVDKLLLNAAQKMLSSCHEVL